MANREYDMDGLSIDGSHDADPGTAGDLRASGNSYMDGIGGPDQFRSELADASESQTFGASYAELDALELPDITDMADPPIRSSSVIMEEHRSAPLYADDPLPPPRPAPQPMMRSTMNTTSMPKTLLIKFSPAILSSIRTAIASNP